MFCEETYNLMNVPYDVLQIMAYEIKTSVSVEPDDLRNYQNALDQLGLEKGTVVYFGRDDFMLTSRIEVKTARTLLLD